jgi:hypothetical protein
MIDEELKVWSFNLIHSFIWMKRRDTNVERVHQEEGSAAKGG